MNAPYPIIRTAKEERWQEHYEDYIYDNGAMFHTPVGLHDEASQYADEMIGEEDAEQLTECRGDPLLEKRDRRFG